MEIDPKAWLSVGRLSADAYRRVLHALERISELAATAPLPGHAARIAANGNDESMVMHVDELEVRYVVEPEQRTVRLVDLRFRS